MKISRFTLSIFFSLLLLLVSADFVSAKDQWIQVKSKNFFLIGNASEKEIRRVGTRLEQFRESFRRIFSNANLTASIPTNVIVFKNSASYKPFKPKRADGKVDEWIAGYFQPGADVNYITLSNDGNDAQTFGTIFHEYVHFIINTNFGKSQVPQWFNEGLAEYYQTFEIVGDIKIKLGLPQAGHLRLLQQNKLMPLDMLFNATNAQVHSSGDHSRSIFYAQSWALVHYLNQTGRAATLEKFLKAMTGGAMPQAAFESVFQTTYTRMETELRHYVSQESYKFNEITFKEKLVFDTEMTTAPLGEAATNAFLGDLLYRSNRGDDSDPYLAAALRLEPGNTMANTSLGMVRMKQGKFDEARTAFEKAIAGSPNSHIPYYQYAQMLSREGRDNFGYVQVFKKETAEKMRVALKKAIELNPLFADSYELFAFVNLVNNEGLDEAASLLETALKTQPANQRYILRLAEIRARQNKLDEAQATAEKIERTSDDPEVKVRALNLLTTIKQLRTIEEQKAVHEASAGAQPPSIKRIEDVQKPTEAEMVRQQEDGRMRSLNRGLRTVAAREQRIKGIIQKIDCNGRSIIFRVKTAVETLLLTAKDFSNLSLMALDAAALNAQVGCDAELSKLNALITYMPAATPGKNRPAGELTAIEFVPADFRVMTAAEMEDEKLIIYDEHDTRPKTSTVILDAETPETASGRRLDMIDAIRGSLRVPAANEKRELGYLETIECVGTNAFVHVRISETVSLKLFNPSPQSLKIGYFTPDMGGSQFGCGMKRVDFPAVITYIDRPDSPNKTAGDIVSVEFVPKGFTLN